MRSAACRLVPALALAAAVAACSAVTRSRAHDDAPGGKAPVPAAVPTGCLAGVVVDGVTGQRLDLTDPALAARLFILENGRELPGAPLLGPGGAAAQPGLAGEYRLCDVPVEVALPLFVEVAGYQPFSSPVLVPATDPSQGAGAQTDLPHGSPATPASVRLFPLSGPKQPFDVVVSADGAPLAGASVWLVPSGAHVLQQGDGFLPPDPVTFRSLSATTDAGGVAEFKAADLALGGVYDYQVIPPDATTQQPKAGHLSVGYVLAPGEPYTFHVDLPPTDLDLRVVSSTLLNGDFRADGTVGFTFNRPIELVPGTVDGVTAHLDHATAAKLVADQPGNNASEQVGLTVSGQTLTLTPKFQTAPSATAEPGAGVTYSGIQVRPASGSRRAHVLSLSPTVRFFGGVAAPSVATSVTVVSGDAQQASAAHTVPNPLVVQVNDQYGLPFAGATVAFAASTGGGSLAPPSASTNAQGQAQASWTLGASGAQAATATVGSVAPATFAATFLPPTNIAVVSGTPQSALVSTLLALPLTVRVTDRNFVNVPGASVTFTVATPATGGLVGPVGGASPAATATITSDSGGQAQASWTLGATGGPFTVSVAAGTATPATFNATAQMPTTLTKSADPAGSANQDLTPIVATIKDQSGAVIQGVTLHFAASGTGTVRLAGGAGAATVNGTSDANGQVSVIWHVAASGTYTVAVSAVTFAGVTPVTFTTTF